ncbi:THAP domain-containing protein 6-like [Engraulis encrasicolus]|uniref:THAP domain-containing protein 6-like n=1 Tax=Engraulis encrasicolus TaxID=184585 RepID=UPI002FD231D4
MPESCIAWNCKIRRNAETKAQGITFHRFPKAEKARKQWEEAFLEKGFKACSSAMLCNKHFREEDMDRTGQTVRIREGAIPTIFDFPPHLQKLAQRKARKRVLDLKRHVASTPLDLSRPDANKQSNNEALSNTLRASEKHSKPDNKQKNEALCNALRASEKDHCYGLSTSPVDLKARLHGALSRVASLERDLRNVTTREKRAKHMVQRLLEDLKRKNDVNRELKEQLDQYAELPLHLLPRFGHEYTKEQKEFSIKVFVHSAKAYAFVRKHLNLPHPRTLQRWPEYALMRGELVSMPSSPTPTPTPTPSALLEKKKSMTSTKPKKKKTDGNDADQIHSHATEMEPGRQETRHNGHNGETMDMGLQDIRSSADAEAASRLETIMISDLYER